MRYFLLIFMCCTANFLIGQKQSAHWFFGSNGGLDFNSGVPVEKRGSLRTLEGSASISDGNGNLLFYTDGTTVYNANHEVMLNGTGLLGNTSSTQSAIIVPDPSNFRRYYIFTVDLPYYDDIDNGIFGVNYNLVDMNLDSGLGGIVNDKKNVQILRYTSEKVAAISHASENAFWIITFSSENNEIFNTNFNTFYAFKVDENGVQTNPVKSVLNIYPNITDVDYRGYLKFSPDGSKLVCNSQGTGSFIADFDPATGVVSNPFELEMEPNVFREEVYGAEFSSSGQYLYIDAFYDTDEGGGLDFQEILGNNRKLYQFDLNASDINASRELIHKSEDFRGTLQMALDGKIYRALSKGYLYESSQTLGVINNPDDVASNVNYDHEAIVLQNSYVTQGLPPFIQSLFLAQIAIESHCLGEPTPFEIFFTEEFKSIVWDFGDPTTSSDTSTDLKPEYTYNSSGTYKVTAEITLLDDSKKVYEKEFSIYDHPNVTIKTDYDHYFLWQQFELEVETQFEDQSEFVFDWEGPNGFNSTEANPTVTIQGIIQNKNYSVAVTSEFGCGGTAEKAITIYEDVQSRLGKDRQQCDGQNLVVGYPKIKDFTYLWNDGLTDNEREITESGTYTLTVTTPDGNENTGSIEVILIPPIELEIESEFSNYFYGDTIEFLSSTNIEEDIEYRWKGPSNLDSNSPSIEVLVEGKQNQGTYSLYIEENAIGCNKTVYKKIYTFIDVETALGNDRYLCHNETATYFYPLEPGFTYLWNDGFTTNERIISEPGTYTLTVTTPDGNTNTGSVIVTKSDLAIEKVETCYNQLFVKPGGGATPYEYSLDGIQYQSNPLFTNVKQGFHKIYVKDAKGCMVQTEGDYFLEFKLYQAFSPNGDYINDTWDLSALKGCRNIEVKIFDRYGKFLHQMKADQLIWNGKVNGKPVPSNTYWFVIEFNDEQTPTLKGHVTIKRTKD